MFDGVEGVFKDDDCSDGADSPEERVPLPIASPDE
jgi:hypothetical protein